MNNKKGFTLVEIIIVIALISIVSGLFVLNMTGVLSGAKSDDNKALISTIESAAKSYVNSNPEKVKNLYEGFSYVDITVGELRDSGFLDEELKNNDTGEVIPDSKKVRVKYNSATGEYSYEYDFDGSLETLKRYDLVAKNLSFRRSNENVSNNTWCNQNAKTGLNMPLEDASALSFRDVNGNYFSNSDNSITLSVENCNVDINKVGNYLINYKYIYNDGKENITSYKTRNVYVLPENIELKYDANGGNGAPNSEELIWSQEYTISSVVPVNSGYNFAGWSYDKNAINYTYKSGDRIMFKPNAEVTSNSTGGYSVTLYAVWKKNEYQVVLNNQNANYAGTTRLNAIYNEGYLDSNSNRINKIDVPKKNGYIFKGYYLSSNGREVYYIDSNGSFTSVANPPKFTSNTVLYASWEAGRYYVDFDTQASNVANPSRKYFVYLSTYSVPNLTREGYIFKGWYDSPTGGSNITNSTIFRQIADGQKLYARWERITFTINFNANGGSGGPSSTTVNYGDSYQLPSSTPSRSCYGFSYWNDGKNNYSANQSYGVIKSNVSFTAQWSYNCYSSGGGGGSSHSSSSSSSSCTGTCQMQKNSVAWHNASPSEQKRLHDENVKIGSSLGLTYNPGNGGWYKSNGQRAYTVNGK